jgi:hypothetical protein
MNAWTAGNSKTIVPFPPRRPAGTSRPSITALRIAPVVL